MLSYTVLSLLLFLSCVLLLFLRVLALHLSCFKYPVTCWPGFEPGRRIVGFSATTVTPPYRFKTTQDNKEFATTHCSLTLISLRLTSRRLKLTQEYLGLDRALGSLAHFCHTCTSQLLEHSITEPLRRVCTLSPHCSKQNYFSLAKHSVKSAQSGLSVALSLLRVAQTSFKSAQTISTEAPAILLS